MLWRFIVRENENKRCLRKGRGTGLILTDRDQILNKSPKSLKNGKPAKPPANPSPECAAKTKKGEGRTFEPHASTEDVAAATPEKCPNEAPRRSRSFCLGHPEVCVGVQRSKSSATRACRTTAHRKVVCREPFGTRTKKQQGN